MDDEGQENEFSEVLIVLHEGLKKAEATMVSILESIVTGNAVYLPELEAALTDVEAALLTD